MTSKPLAVLPRLALPDWLHAWALGAPTPSAAVRVLVVAFGLVRSLPMLETTLASLERHAPANATLAVRAVVSTDLFGAANASLRLRARLRMRSVTLFEAHDPVPIETCDSAKRAAENRNELEAAHLLTSVGGEWDAADVAVLWRLDTELVSPIEAPALPAGCVLVPHLQSGGLLNDRYLVGHAATVRRLVDARAALLESECVYGEQALVRLLRELGLRVGFTRTRAVRRRADQWIPDIDRAASLGSIAARGWMQRINSLTPALVCDNATACAVRSTTMPGAAAASRVFGVHGEPHSCPYYRAWEARCVWSNPKRQPALPEPLPLARVRWPQRLLVLGDSLDAQLFAAVACHLHAHRETGVQIELQFEAKWESSVAALRKRCGADGALRCHYTSASLVVRGPEAMRVPFTEMHLCQGDRSTCLLGLSYNPDSDVVVTGADALHGLAHGTPRAFVRGVPNVTTVRTAARRDARSVFAKVPASRLVWREATAQHFPAKGGHWLHGFMMRSNIEKLEQRCADIPLAQMRAHAYWNPAVAPLLEARNVRVLRTWEASARAWHAHVDHGDCTHFCQEAAPLKNWAVDLLRLLANG